MGVPDIDFTPIAIFCVIGAVASVIGACALAGVAFGLPFSLWGHSAHASIVGAEVGAVVGGCICAIFLGRVAYDHLGYR